MRKILLVSAAALCWAVGASAQRTGSVAGTVMDRSTGEPMIGATIEVKSATDTAMVKYNVSQYNGKFSVTALPYGDYSVSVTFMGYGEWKTPLTLNQRTIDLGSIILEPSAQAMAGVTVEVQAIRTSQRGDTVSYNAAAFKVAQDADAEQLLAKMPGITVSDGTVEAQGETVRKITVDGKEYFGEDVTAALKNIPAEVITDVQVVNRLSDQAELTGIDDGEGYKALNFVTIFEDEPDISAQYGRVYAGYGFDDKYTVGANVTMLKNERSITLQGMSNNLNQLNFGSSDILGVSDDGHGRYRVNGISTPSSLGISYNNSFEKVKVNLSYRFGTLKNDMWQRNDMEYYNGEFDSHSTSSSDSRNNSHSVNGRIDWKINDRHSIVFRPNVSMQTNNSSSNSESIKNAIINAMPARVSQQNGRGTSDRDGYNIGGNLVYRVKLGERRSLSLQISGQVSKNDNNSYDSTRYLNWAATIPDRQIQERDSLYGTHTINDQSGYRVNGNVTYTEGLSQFMALTGEYRISYNYQDQDRRQYLWDELIGGYDPALSNNSSIQNSGYLTHNIGPGFNFSRNRNVVTANVTYQRSTLARDRDFPAPRHRLDASFDNVVYFMMIRKVFNPQNTLRIFARSSTDTPSVGDLNDIATITPSRISVGNPNLDPSYSHSINATYNRTSITKGTTFTASADFSTTANSIADSIVMVFPGASHNINVNGEQVTLTDGTYTKPINLSGRWSARGRVSFGMPVLFIRCNLDLGVRASYSETPGMLWNVEAGGISGGKNILKTQNYNFGPSLSSNISQKLDFRISYDVGYLISNNTIRKSRDREQVTQHIHANFKWVTWADFTLSGNGNYTKVDTGEEYLLCNAFVGKKIFRNRRGEISAGVNDLFNQNENFSRSFGEMGVSTRRSNTIGRYVSVQFVYTLPSKTSLPTDRTGRGGDGRPTGGPEGGRPPGGGPGMGGPGGGGGFR